MSPELPEADLRRVIRQRMREGILPATTRAVLHPQLASGRNVCFVCGFAITVGRNECVVSKEHAHERCAIVWREESERSS